MLDFDCSHAKDIIKDKFISLNYRNKGFFGQLRQDCYFILTRIALKLEFITNLKGLDALTTALLYIKRWVFEVHYKQIKQKFELKYFLSDSENGIKIRIWVALETQSAVNSPP